MWIVIVASVMLFIVIVALIAGRQGHLYEVFDDTGKMVCLGSMKQCADYIELRRTAGYKGEFKTKRYER